MLLCSLLLVFMMACQNSNEMVVERRQEAGGTTLFSGEVMTMRYKIIVGAILGDNQIDKIKELIHSTFQEVNLIYNKWNPDSELSQLNRLKAGVKVEISPALEHLFKETQLIVELSNGLFDPTIEPLQQLWKEKLNQEKIPSDAELNGIASMIGWDKVHVADGLFYKDHEGVKLDFGGIAKGLAIDLLVERLENLGHKDVFVEWGGEIRAAGLHPEQRLWKIYISHLGDDDPEHAIDTVSLDNQAIATSGDYLQNWSVWAQEEKNVQKRVTYFHIFDPYTLRPLKASNTSVASVSVVASNCVFADGLATAAMLCADSATANKWAEEIKVLYPEVSFWIVSRKQVNK